MRKIWKYGMLVGGASLTKNFYIPKGSVFLHLDLDRPIDQHNLLPRDLNFWFDVDDEEEKVLRQISLRGTGFAIPEDAIYLGTVIPSPLLVLHAFETYDI